MGVGEEEAVADHAGELVPIQERGGAEVLVGGTENRSRPVEQLDLDLRGLDPTEFALVDLAQVRRGVVHLRRRVDESPVELTAEGAAQSRVRQDEQDAQHHEEHRGERRAQTPAQGHAPDRRPHGPSRGHGDSVTR
jgi:hypothetical protein